LSEENQKQQEMIGARFGQASLRRNARRDSRQQTSQNESPQHSKWQSEQIEAPQSAHLVTAALPHGVPTSLSLDTYSICQDGFMESPLNISVQPCNPASRATLNLIPKSLELKSWSTKSTGLCLRSSDGAEQLLNIGDESLRAIGFGRYGGYANGQRFAG
jgi:hypothetical protein